jgi:hypothetical protein
MLAGSICMKITRVWAMPSPNTFSIPPIADLLDRWLPRAGVTVDPFARDSTRATVSNDLDPAMPTDYHMEAGEFVRHLEKIEYRADAVLFDPPYSPRQISECYKKVGLAISTATTQNARLYKEVRDGLDAILHTGGIAISCGWNSRGFGTGRGYEIEEILLVTHGGAHNDTIVTVDRKR